MALLLCRPHALGLRGGVCLVDDNQIRCLQDKQFSARVAFDVVNRDNLKPVVRKHTRVALDFAIQCCLCIGANHDRFDIEFGTDFVLPLFTQMRWADDGEPFD